jgi:hypothetical protein
MNEDNNAVPAPEVTPVGATEPVTPAAPSVPPLTEAPVAPVAPAPEITPLVAEPAAVAPPDAPVSSPFGVAADAGTPFAPEAPAGAAPVASVAPTSPIPTPATNDPFAGTAPAAKSDGITIAGKKITTTTLILFIVLGVLIIGAVVGAIFLLGS